MRTDNRAAVTGARFERGSVGKDERRATARLSGIEGLRAVAATSVLVYHVFLYGAPNGRRVALPLEKVFDNLRAGVTLFFVLSGFLLFRPFVAAALRGLPSPSVRNYLRNRALRIVPAYWVILLGIAIFLQHELLTRPLQLGANLLFLQNYVPNYVVGGDDRLGIVPSWSLCIEIVFYLVLPVLGGVAIALAARRLSAVVSCLAPVAFMVALGLASKAALHPADLSVGAHRVVEFSLLTHADWFAAGMAVSVGHVLWEDGRLSPRRWVLPSALVGSTALAVVATKLYYGGRVDAVEQQTPFALACAVLLALVVTASPRSLLRRFLTLRLVYLAGLASYSLFLVHDPLVRSFREWGLTVSGVGGFFVNLLLIGTVSFTLAAIIYRLVERTALGRKRGWQAGDSSGFGSSAPPDLPEAVEIAVEPESVELRSALQPVVDRVAGARAHRVVLDVPAALEAPIDRTILDTVLSSLLENAVRYGSPPIRVSAHVRHGCLVLDVSDRGRGVETAFVPHLFEPHTRSERSSATTTGEGMGLARALIFARAHGGGVAYRPRLLGGACFRVTFALSGAAEQVGRLRSAVGGRGDPASRGPIVNATSSHRREPRRPSFRPQHQR